MDKGYISLEHFSILDVHYNSNFLGVDVNGRGSFIFSALYRHQNLSGKNLAMRSTSGWVGEGSHLVSDDLSGGACKNKFLLREEEFFQFSGLFSFFLFEQRIYQILLRL